MMYKIPKMNEILDYKKTFKYVSLFAGAGGSSCGYYMSGGECLYANEFIAIASGNYRKNFPQVFVDERSIRDISPLDILNKIKIKKYDLPLLDGSPPCSAFSTLGSISNGWGKIKKYSETSQSNIEDLFFEYIRILRGLMPKVFIAENVSGLSVGKSKGYFNEILIGLKESGYYIESKIINAKHLGVPQSRSRIFIVGVRVDLVTHQLYGMLHPTPEDKIITLGEAFEGLDITEEEKKETEIGRFKVFEKLKKMKDGTIHKKNFSLSKGSSKKYSECITATCSKLGALNAYHWENRAYSVMELKRIMSLPDDFILLGNYSQQVERIGRMVAPLVSCKISKNLIDIGVLN